MSVPATHQIGVLGLGICAPEKVLSNADFEKMLNTSDEWIMSRTGIRERRILAEDQVPTDIATEAARRAMDDAGVKPEEIDAIIYCTYIPDHFVPPSSAIVQGRLGLKSCMTYDLNGACTGFILGMQNAYALLRAGLVKKVLLIGCDCASRIVDYTDRSTCVLFGDGAGAVVMGEVNSGRGVLGTFAGADGQGAFLIHQKLGGGAYPLGPDNATSSDRFMKMNGREVFKFAVRIFNEALEKALADAGLTIADVDLLVPHQANVRIIQSAMEKFGFRPESVVINIDKYGNTSAASIPLALESAREAGQLKQGTVCALVAFGAGLTYGATILRW